MLVEIKGGFAKFSQDGDTPITAATISCNVGSVVVHESELWAVWEALDTLGLNPKVTHVTINFSNEVPVLQD